MTGDNLAEIYKVDIKEGWSHEALEFTPWLAANLDKLGDALGVPLQLQGQEIHIGNYRLDILATVPYDGRSVIIENQLGPTDNDHLSRLLIYAAGKDAKLIVWVADEVKDEHRQVLDWLNQRTDNNTLFYGVAVELWKIDDSRPAPHFNVVIAPNTINKGSGPVVDQQLDEQPNIGFRRPLKQKLRDHGIIATSGDTTAGPWCVIGYTLLGVKCTAFWQKSLNFEVTVKKSGAQGQGWNQKACQLLSERRGAIQSQIDPQEAESWDWQIGDEAAKVVVSRPGNIYDNPEQWDEYHDWIIAKFFKFREVFTPLLAELAAAAGE